MNREHNMKTVTVVIPSYNRAKILPKTIPTYLQPDVNELIIIDDCSSDNTEQVVKKLQKKYPIIKYFRNEVNSKQTFSKNVGIKNATCDYIYFGDDDSIIKPGTIKRLIEVKDKFPLPAVTALFGSTTFPSTLVLQPIIASFSASTFLFGSLSPRT